MTPPPDFVLFVGRFHVLLVHLPIGLIMLVAFLELLARWPRFKTANAALGPVLALAVPVSIASAVCGWLLSLSGGYEAGLLQLHKWSGIAVATACTLTALAYWLNLKKLYRLGVVASFVVLMGASHFGGSLTHGKDYLIRYAPGPVRAWLGGDKNAPASTSASRSGSVAEKQAFADVIRPVLDQYCIGCHGPEKAKAKLRLDSYGAILKGSEHGPIVVPGKPADSEIIRRLHLPPEHDDHMPPDGKPQPGAADIELLEWWISAGTPADKKVGELQPPPQIQRLLDTRLGTAAAAAPAPTTAAPKPLAEVLPLAEKLTDELSISVTLLGQNEPWLQCNASLAGTNFGDAELAKLAPLGANLRWLDLAGTLVTDTGLAPVAAMRNLTRLHLERTAITDAGLAALGGLSELEYLNLYGTAVTDFALGTLKSLPKLRQLYLWQSQVTPEAAKAFAEARVDKAQIAKWEQEIKQLHDQIRNQRMAVELGAPATAASDLGPVPINTVCPVSGKPADRTKTLLYEGKLVAFCCDDCKASFEKDPKPHLARLAQFASTPPGNLASPKPVNAKCPVSGKDVDPTKISIYDSKLVTFCCENCKAKFDQDPKRFLPKLGLNSSDDAPPNVQKP